MLLISAMLMFSLQLAGQISWDTWWVPMLLVADAPVGFIASYAFGGETLRGVGVAAAAWVILIGLGAVGVSAGMTTDRGGEVIALVLAVATGAALVLAAWSCWDLGQRARVRAIESKVAAPADSRL